ncbi:hypothetical protein N7520_007808 [Penicillium odoratum]|uniref:uncharacterized protein n=1 Tax=Penicillium odoratum TaxID=1167516 RepID=UPI0025471913|nr:uncharacterized protein N7520_007808 [Penicillium odoratum]KAJ5760652.1 hypothetical protein N7520_007808 [Penicillium odoratum]
MAQTGSERPKKKRIRKWTAEDRAVLREFEKSSSEAFADRDILLKRFDSLRSLSQPDASVLRQALPIDPAVLKLLKEEKKAEANRRTSTGNPCIDGSQQDQPPSAFAPMPFVPVSGDWLSQVTAHNQIIPQILPIAYNSTDFN